jgi:hypothetical membrane protein
MHATETRSRLSHPGVSGRGADLATGGLRLAGVLLFVLAAQFLVVITLAASAAPEYDLSGGAISDLGVIPETALAFNLSLLAVGLLNIAGGYLLYRRHQRPWVLAIFVVAGIGAVGAGTVPLDRGATHGLFALAAFVFFNIEALAVATIVGGPLRVLSLIAGLVGLAFVGLMIVGDAGNPGAFGPIGHGGVERMIVYPVMLWMLALGGALMGRDGETWLEPPL